jgi:hypothetical protein
MDTVPRLAQLKKAFAPMDVTVSGMITRLRVWQSAKALSPIDVTVFGM